MDEGNEDNLPLNLKLVKEIEEEKKMLQRDLKHMEWELQRAKTIEERKMIEVIKEDYTDKLKECDSKLQLWREGKLEEGFLRFDKVLKFLGPRTDKLKSMLNVQRLIVYDIEEAEKKGKKANKKYAKSQKELTAHLESLYSEWLEKEADPEWVKEDFEKKWKYLGLDDNLKEFFFFLRKMMKGNGGGKKRKGIEDSYL